MVQPKAPVESYQLYILLLQINPPIWRRLHEDLQGWGAKVIDRLSADLQQAFPKLGGYSARNLKYMRAFAKSWPDRSIVQQLAAQIPWMHNCLLLDRVKDQAIRSFCPTRILALGISGSALRYRTSISTEVVKPGSMCSVMPSTLSRRS